jgi:hypothetical protein
MAMRFVKFGAIHVNPSRVLFVTDVFAQGEINVGDSTSIKTGLPVSQVIKMLEDAMGNQTITDEVGPYPPEIVHKALLADVVRYLEEKLAKNQVRDV